MGAPAEEFAGLRFPSQDHLLVELHTDEGITGWGDSFGHNIIPATLKALECYVAPWFIGKDPIDINTLHRLAAQAFMFSAATAWWFTHIQGSTSRFGILRVSAGGALSDLLGGGRRKTVEAYSSLMRFSNPKTVKRICAERAARPCRLGASTVSADRRQFDHQYPWSISETVYLRKEPSDTPDVSRGCIPQNSRAGAP